MNCPLVSVCVPTYNRMELLQETLLTLHAQRFRDFELIVCDDCSSDGTWEFLCSLKWPNLKILRNATNMNLPGTMARLFLNASGRYIGMQHDHDLYEPEFLVKMVELMESHPTAGFGCCAFTRLDELDKRVVPPVSEFYFYSASGIRPGSDLIKVLASRMNTPIPAMGTIFRRETVESAGGYRPDWYLAADEDLYRRVAAISDVAFTMEPLFAMRTRPVERNAILGGWKAIYTLHDFRADTVKRYARGGVLRKSWGLARLRLLRFKLLLVECAAFVSRGQVGQLRDATNLKALPRLPSGGPSLSSVERLLVGLWGLLLIRLYSVARARRGASTNIESGNSSDPLDYLPNDHA
jgi:glycosyltransferase involved in cell wall biosynthesis